MVKAKCEISNREAGEMLLDAVGNCRGPRSWEALMAALSSAGRYLFGCLSVYPVAKLVYVLFNLFIIHMELQSITFSIIPDQL